MARLLSQTIAAPTGADITSDPVTMPLNRARRLLNWLIDRPGIIRTNVALNSQLAAIPNGPPPPPGTLDGVFYYYDATTFNSEGFVATLHTDLLMWANGGFLYSAIPAVDPFTGMVTNQQAVIPIGYTGYCPDTAFFVGKHVRSASLLDEIVFVQEGGILPLRFYSSAVHGVGFYRAGIQPPTSQAPNENLILSQTGTGLTGTWLYKLTFADEHGRKSSPTEATPSTLANQGTAAEMSTLFLLDQAAGVYIGQNLVTAQLYRNTQGAPDTFYQIAETTTPTTTNLKTFPVGSFFFDPSVAYDNAPDIDIVGNALCPSPGENDPPNPASIICTYRNRIFANDVTNSSVLQVSNTLSTTQWTLIPTTPIQATDGIRSSVGTDQGDPITALIEFGSYLAIFKRRGCFFLSGDDLSNFSIQPIHQRGCIAPDSCVRCDNVICFLSDDGIYTASYLDGEIVQKISKEIEADLFGTRFTTEQAEKAVGWYVDRRYHLAVGLGVYVFDFDAQAWTAYAFGNGSLGATSGIPDIHNFVGFGFQGFADSGLQGSVVADEATCAEPPRCNVTLDTDTILATGAGGAFNIQLIDNVGAPITYTTLAIWLRVTGPRNGNGTAIISVDPNPDCIIRTGRVTICGNLVTVTQGRAAGCTCSMNSLIPSVFGVDYTAQSVTTAYNEKDNTPITEFTSSPWLHPQPPVAGVGNSGTIAILIDENDTCADRSGTVQVCDLMVTINQGYNPACCSLSVSTHDLGIINLHASATFTVTASATTISYSITGTGQGVVGPNVGPVVAGVVTVTNNDVSGSPGEEIFLTVTPQCDPTLAQVVHYVRGP